MKKKMIIFHNKRKILFRKNRVNRVRNECQKGCEVRCKFCEWDLQGIHGNTGSTFLFLKILGLKILY